MTVWRYIGRLMTDDEHGVLLRIRGGMGAQSCAFEVRLQRLVLQETDGLIVGGHDRLRAVKDSRALFFKIVCSGHIGRFPLRLSDMDLR